MIIRGNSSIANDRTPLRISVDAFYQILKTVKANVIWRRQKIVFMTLKLDWKQAKRSFKADD